MFQTKVVEKIKTHILCAITFLESCTVYDIMWENNVEPGRPQVTVWRMRIAFWVPKAKKKNTHTICNTLLLLHYNNGCRNTPHCNVIRTLRILFICNYVSKL